jgi:hypothetical protein
LFAVLMSGALIDVAHGSDLVECEPQRVTGSATPPRVDGESAALATILRALP